MQTKLYGNLIVRTHHQYPRLFCIHRRVSFIKLMLTWIVWFKITYNLCYLLPFLEKQTVTWQQNLMLTSSIIKMKLRFNKYYRVWDKGFNVLILQYKRLYIYGFIELYRKREYYHLYIFLILFIFFFKFVRPKN